MRSSMACFQHIDRAALIVVDDPVGHVDFGARNACLFGFRQKRRPILTSASSAARAICAPPKARTMRATATSATISSRENISGGSSKPSRMR